MKTFEEFKAFAKTLKITGKNEKELQANYHAWWDANADYAKSIGMPRNPDEVYAKK